MFARPSLPFLTLFCLLAACGSDTVSFDGPDFPTAGVAAAAELLVVPDSDWYQHPDRDVWAFRGRGRVYVDVRQRPLSPLRIYLQGDPEDAGKLYQVSWNGEILLDEATAPNRGDLEIEIPRDRLEPGRYVLEVRRIYRRGAGSGHDNTFSGFGYRLGRTATEFTFDQLPRFQYLAAFLGRGVTGLDTGSGPVRRDGLVMLAGASAKVDLDLPAAGHLELVLENVSDSMACFSLGEEGGPTYIIAVQPQSQRDARIPVKSGRQRLALRVDRQTPDGIYLWGEPTFTPRPPRGERLAAEPAEAAVPVFLITLDTTRKDALSPYGGDPALTPNLQHFAHGATVFDNAYSTSPWTLPSHASIFTGVYPSHHEAGVGETQLPAVGSAARPTLASELRAAGYFTAGFAGGRMVHHDYGVGRGFAHYRDPDAFETPGDRLTAYLEAQLRRRAFAAKPLFVFANYFDPHALYLAPREFRQRAHVGQHRQALEGHPIWQTFDRAEAGATAAWRQMIDGEATVTPELLAYLRAAYHSEIAFLDHQLGRLFELLRELDLYDQALIILVADHGELLGEYGGLFSHAGRLDPELTEIPLLIKWPGQSEGRRVEELVSQVDLFATVLEAVELPMPDHGQAHPSDGRSLAALVQGHEVGDWDERRYLFLEEHESRIHPLPERLRLGAHVYGLQRPLFRQLVWQAGRRDEGQYQGECYRRPEHGPELVWLSEPCEARPEAVLQRIERTLGVAEQVQDAGVVSAEDEAALKALGYL